MNKSETPRCAICGAILLKNTPAGECVRCLLTLAVETGPPQPIARTPSESGSARRVHYFGDYELLELIGQGGMGKVWKARQVSLNRVVALKMIHAGRFAGADEVARFHREAEAAAGLDHPNIVPVYEVGEHENQHYFTMKLVNGHTLAENRRGRTADQAAALVAKVARAVHHAHQRGIMHRDLKPANILLDLNGEPHLADFGLARLIDSSTALTRTHGIMGSFAYMSPEQSSGKPTQLTTAVDIYALGCILYEMLTGQPPRPAKTLAEAIQKSAEEVQSPCALNRSVDRDLESITLQCLQRDAARRYGSAAALSDDLERWSRHEPISARGPTRWERVVNVIRRHPVRTALGGVLLLAVLMIGTFFYASHRTYLWLLGNITDEHPVTSPRNDGTYLLPLRNFKDHRCTHNFWKRPFGPLATGGRYARLEITNVSPEMASTLKVRVWSDVPAYPDVPRTAGLTNGQIFFLTIGELKERAFYFGEVNFDAPLLRLTFPDAAIRIVLLGWLNDMDPYQPAGRVHRSEGQ